MKWFFGLFSKSDRLAPEPAKSSRVQPMNPSKILFSVPTLAGDIANLEPIDRPPTRGDVVISEDDWSQLEFYPQSALTTVQGHLTELKTFAEANRKGSGWRKVYVRKIERSLVITAADPIRHLEKLLGVKAGAPPFIIASSAIAGRIGNGFSFDLGGNTQLYGYLANNGIPVLAASVGAKADNMKLATAFMRLHQSDKVMLVDWRAQLLLVGVSPDGNIQTWRP